MAVISFSKNELQDYQQRLLLLQQEILEDEQINLQQTERVELDPLVLSDCHAWVLYKANR